MITVETSLRHLQSERRGLESLLVSQRYNAQFILGALAALDWIEHGCESPLEQCSPVVARAIAEDPL